MILEVTICTTAGNLVKNYIDEDEVNKVGPLFDSYVSEYDGKKMQYSTQSDEDILKYGADLFLKNKKIIKHVVSIGYPTSSPVNIDNVNVATNMYELTSVLEKINETLERIEEVSRRA